MPQGYIPWSMGMQTIVAGSRDITDYQLVKKVISSSGFEISCIFSGTARGVDSLGEQWAKEHGVPIKYFDPDEYEDTKDDFGGSKFIARNHAMARNADALIAIWDGESPGTKSMQDIARRNELKIHVHRTDTHSLFDF